MVLLISPEEDIKDEINILHQLFEAGVEYFHLRKPNKSLKEHCEYLNQIDEKYHKNIVLHHFHELVVDYNLRGIHYQEAKRQKTPLKSLDTIKNKYRVSISSSFHSTKTLLNCEFNFNYHLLSPVFTSISKQNYAGKGFNVNHINKTVVGLGGVTANNLLKFTQLGYKGVGVLGSIWYSKTPVKTFDKINKLFNEYQKKPI